VCVCAVPYAGGSQLKLGQTDVIYGLYRIVLYLKLVASRTKGDFRQFTDIEPTKKNFTEESVESHPAFRRDMSPPSSGRISQKNSMKQVSKRDLKMAVICSSETSVDFQQTTRCYIPQDMTS
jgi:hypothetical protein